jgi:hypothetical protein
MKEDIANLDQIMNIIVDINKLIQLRWRELGH